MKGHVDADLRALIPVRVAAKSTADQKEILAWVDTTFNGSLVLPRNRIQELELVQESSAEAVLADGSTVELETCACFVEWFGATHEIQVIANDSEYPLLGTILLAGHRLEIDYDKKRSN